METEKVGPISSWPLPICTLAGMGTRFRGCASTPEMNTKQDITARIVRTIRSPDLHVDKLRGCYEVGSIVEVSTVCKLQRLARDDKMHSVGGGLLIAAQRFNGGGAGQLIPVPHDRRKT